MGWGWLEKLIGLGLMGLAVMPTPDDATVVSPLIQFGAGFWLFSGRKLW